MAQVQEQVGEYMHFEKLAMRYMYIANRIMLHAESVTR